MKIDGIGPIFEQRSLIIEKTSDGIIFTMVSNDTKNHEIRHLIEMRNINTLKAMGHLILSRAYELEYISTMTGFAES